MNYYVVKPGSDAHLWEEFRKEGVAKISYKEMEIGDLRRYDSIQDVYTKADEIKGYHKAHAEILFAFKNAEMGGILFAGKGVDEIVGVGIITGPYVYLADAPKTYRHQRSVRWLGEINYRYNYHKVDKSRLGRVNAFGSLRKFAYVTQDIARQNPELQQQLLAAGVPIEDFGNEGTTKLSVDEWRQILADQSLVGVKERKILTAFYHSPEHGDNCYAIAAKVKGIPRDEGQNIAVGGPMGKLGERIFRSLEREVHVCNRDDDIPCYYNLLFSDEPNARGLQWTMRPNLVKAFSLLNTEPLPEVIAKKEPQLETTEPLNQILYGPPGTGKTYATVTKAIAILENRKLDDVKAEDRMEVLRRFRAYQKSGRVAFTTFHQSLSYEDFVEGLKPKITREVEESTGDVEYEIKRGIFKDAATAAIYSAVEVSEAAEERATLNFAEKYDAFVRMVRVSLAEEEPVELSTWKGKEVYVRELSDKKSLWIYHGKAGETKHTVSRQRLIKLNNKIKERGEISNINKFIPEAIGGANYSAYYAAWKAINDFTPVETSYKEEDYSVDEKADIISELDLSTLDFNRAQNHVLIIDEINRGNVSAILGELITLLEPDKRLGGDEALTVTLPYSRDEFGVPPNLYLIGTMNTADRSVEALDAALRRRFTFKEVAPDPAVISRVHPKGGIVSVGELEVDLAKLLTLLNRRIKALKDADHQLGHSYFLRVNDWQGLASAFCDRIIPLLREYFFANYGQLQMVVGKGFCRQESEKEFSFADSNQDEEYGSDYQSYLFHRPASATELADYLGQLGLL